MTEPAIALRRQVNNGRRTQQEIQTMVNAKKGKQFFDAFRANIVTFSEIEAGLLGERQAAATQAEQSAHEHLEVMIKNKEWVTHTYEVIEHANTILAAAADMETGMRGYLLAGRDEFPAPYCAGQARILELVGSLKQTVNDNPA